MKKIIFTLFIMVLAISLGLINQANSATKRKIYRTEQRDATFGGSGHIMTFACSDILNKKSQFSKKKKLY